jgi:hypothetical protein
MPTGERLGSNRGQRRLPMLQRKQVVDDETRHRLTRLASRAAEVGRQDDVWEPEELLRHVRLVREDIEPGMDPARNKLGDQCRLLDDLAPRRVDEAGAVVQERQPPRIDQPLRLGSQGHMNRDNVCLREERIEVPELGKVGVYAPSLRVEKAELEPAGTAGDGTADTPETEDAERRSGHLLGKSALGPGRCPAAGADEPVALDELPPGREDECDGQIRRGAVEDARRVRDDDATLGAGAEIDAVVADAEVGDDPQIGKKVERHGLVRDEEGLDVGARSVESRKRQQFEVVELVEGRPGVAAGGDDLHGRSIARALPIRAKGESGAAPVGAVLV